MDEKKFMMGFVLHGVMFGCFFLLWNKVIVTALTLPTLTIVQAIVIFMMMRAMFLLLEIAL